MLRPAVRFTLLLVLAGGLSGCTLFHWGKRKQAKPQEAQPTRIGRVELVNSEEHFVLIEAPVGTGPEPGTTLRAYNGSTVTAELRSTSVRKRPYLVADLISGTPGRNDVIVQPVGKDTAVAKASAANAPEATPAPKSRSGNACSA